MNVLAKRKNYLKNYKIKDEDKYENNGEGELWLNTGRKEKQIDDKVSAIISIRDCEETEGYKAFGYRFEAYQFVGNSYSYFSESLSQG